MSSTQMTNVLTPGTGRSPASDRQSNLISDTEPQSVTLYILSTREQVHVPLQSKAVLGRLLEPNVEGTLHIDLTPYYGHQLGVSRRHMMLVYDSQQRLMAFDLNSQNGTFLNGQRLSSHTGYLVSDGDELMLGSLTIRVYCRNEIPFVEKESPYAQAPLPSVPPGLTYPEPNIRETLETRPLTPTQRGELPE